MKAVRDKATVPEEKIVFNRDIRPLLSKNCFQCHGPDEKNRQTELRLDIESAALADLGDYRAIVPGKPQESELYRRITATDADVRMPPEEVGRRLSPAEVNLFRRWIEAGAVWQRHWSLIPPERPPLPDVRQRGWPRNAIDFHVLSHLEREGLSPSPEATRETLIRRLSLDLTGLPPSPQQIDAFLADDSPLAYDRLVDRLLASVHFGERMSLQWLDAARYADTNGYQNDGERFMWRWRDWVIDAYNRNMPFDQFTIEQLAGDLLPDPTLDQLIATGFNRNHRGNSEGGVIAEEYLVEYVVDRVDTTFTVWQGLTIGCARCHDHKFDPFTQQEFYRLFAFFNNVPERGRVVKVGNSEPVIMAPSRPMQYKMAELHGRLDAAKKTLRDGEPQLALAQQQWAHSLSEAEEVDETVAEGLVTHFRFDGDATDARGAAAPAVAQGGEIVYVAGRIGGAAEFDGTQFLDSAEAGNFGETDEFSCGAWVQPGTDRSGTILSRMEDDANRLGYEIRLENGHVYVSLVNRWLDDAIRVHTRGALASGRWGHVMFTYDGTRSAGGLRLFVNGRQAEVRVDLDVLNNEFATTAPLKIAAGPAGGPFRGLIDDVRFYDRELPPEDVDLVAATDTISHIAAIGVAKRTARQSRKLRSYFLAHHAPQNFRQLQRRLKSHEAELAALEDRIPTVMIMRESPTPRDTFVLFRGEYDKPRAKVTAGVPASLGPLPAASRNDRLGLASWLVDPANPLTARVAVNRYWQLLFGKGIVRTTEDFGSQGEWPSHPQLLDWLATEYVRNGWDTKALLRTIVTSATYRQSSRVTAASRQQDPDNRWFGRGPRFRLPAQTIRDQALAAGGLLSVRVGGPSVRPYQPEGLWKEVTANKVYVQDHGEALYRRSLYTFWKRTVAPPTMMAFDAASRETCIVRTSRTNTPLQALALLNDPTFVEASRHLAARMIREGGSEAGDRIRYGFRLLTARWPSDAELSVLAGGYRQYRDEYGRNPAAVDEILAVGESPVDPQLDRVELAALTAVAGIILNTDEVVNKE